MNVKPTTTALTLLAFMAFGTVAPAAADAEGVIGMKQIKFHAEHHGKNVDGVIWYPTNQEINQRLFAENPVFKGFEVSENAPVKRGEFPLVLLSHGMGGGYRSMAWLAEALVKEGVVVAGVRHPNTSWGDFDLSKGVKHWSRAQDLSQILDEIENDKEFAGKIDQARVMAAGFSYGGWTALSLGGVKGNHQGFVAHCQLFQDASTYCDKMLDQAVGLTEIDAPTWNASYADDRVTHVVAIDPGLTWGIQKKDVSDPIPNVRLIGLGAGETRMTATDFSASGFGALVPTASVNVIDNAIHFTALPVCKSAGAKILEMEKDDPVCTDPIGTDRAEVHAMIAGYILKDLMK
ncbi:MAG: alpha/beta hydrolase family protein [Alphaproteobacteria bacterium]